MAIAKKCDVCGEFYEQYNTRQSNENPNGFMFLNIDQNQQYYKNNANDCCPRCMDSIQNYIKLLRPIR